MLANNMNPIAPNPRGETVYGLSGVPCGGSGTCIDGVAAVYMSPPGFADVAPRRTASTGAFHLQHL
jgi:hypothetical protein